MQLLCSSSRGAAFRVPTHAMRSAGWASEVGADAKRQLQEEFAPIGWNACAVDQTGRVR